MTNPWLKIPEADYVGHMNNPAVGQRAVLNRLLGETLGDSRPSALLVVGCSTGNGFEHIDPAITKRVTGVDVNGAYLRTLVKQYGATGFALDAQCADVMTCEFARDSYDLIHAALVLEYLPWRALLPRVATWLKPGGALSVVVQGPSESSPPVTPTPFPASYPSNPSSNSWNQGP